MKRFGALTSLFLMAGLCALLWALIALLLQSLLGAMLEN
jgi:hypothetical protein